MTIPQQFDTESRIAVIEEAVNSLKEDNKSIRASLETIRDAQTEIQKSIAVLNNNLHWAKYVAGAIGGIVGWVGTIAAQAFSVK